MLLLLLFSILAATILAQTPCAPRVYRGPDNPTTCVCNATYCDTITPLGILASNQIAVYTSSQSGKRFDRTTLNFGSSSAASIQIRVNTNQKNQTIFGFGGAFTDSTGSNLIRLSQEARNNLIRAYFAPEGIGYTVGRTPIGSADYSLAPYSYDDTQGDFNLTNFELNIEDFEYRIPFIQQAIQLTNGKIRLYASPWSAPGWMKVTGKTGTGGALIGEVNGQYYQTWANYIVRFFEEYNKNNITFWGVTMENEPIEGGWANYKWNAMYFNSTMERDFAKGVWGQTLRNNPLTKNLKLMVMDDQRQYLEQFADDILGDPDANKVVDGVALHWYGDGHTLPSLLTEIHDKFPDKFLLYTEACILSPPALGSWADGNNYMHYIINILNNWVIGFVDWNMALNPQGGPSWMGNSYGSPIIVSNTVDEFEKNPTFYAMGHLAKFIVPDSVIVGLNIANLPANLDAVAALTPSGQKVIVLNNQDVAANYTISVYNDQGSYVNLNLEARSFTTLVFN